MAAHRINVFLNNNLSQKIINKIKELEMIQQAYTEIMPLLAEHSTAVSFSQSKLKLIANNGATALKLKQMVPTLRTEFKKRGFEVTAIFIEAQVYVSTNKLKSLKIKKVGERGAQTLIELSEQLPESTLKSALKRLANRR